ncbi:hypothetical protein ATHL_03398 [Anaerolinea thermolimosa]|uniref:Uncharacterized protein n=1 Tax=Anaerolinea thermolimosa TaxID=229919 RepID=A0A7U9PU94_9CHLR|nr:hypothetical protein ATHL_03398 [Anaerolinea thermolimosa]
MIPGGGELAKEQDEPHPRGNRISLVNPLDTHYT